MVSARTMQRNLIAKFLGKGMISSALVAFYDEFSDDWRLSFVKVEKELVRDKHNNLKIKNKLSPPKRFSFLVGGEKNHTCKRRFKSLIEKSEIPKLEDIEEVFSVETVTDEFFDKYKQLFLDLKEDLDRIREEDTDVDNDLKENNIESSDFAKKLMGQLVFIYFLQKKGWLGVKKDEKWGTGSKNFLRKLYNKEYGEYENFFNDVIEPLFYEGFSKDVYDNHFSKFNFKVPFLNGGLFEPINGYDWKSTNIILDNSIFEKILNTFDRFNFTVKEDEPLEKEVAVDPEMLGKVFENLLEIKEQRDKGAYYTPRYIVHYICQESLINYLSTRSEISEEDLREFIINGDTHIDAIIRNHEERKKYNGKAFTPIKLPDSIMNNSIELDKLLSKVKIIDPAVGSGAFPVGMMNEIVKARNILKLYDNFESNIYDLKKETIENSLYGVDIELSATDITKLRFWLSLIVDEVNVENIHPLPNLNNKIMCGNSLVDSFAGADLFDETLIVKSSQTRFATNDTERDFNKIEAKKREYFKISDSDGKKEIENEIKALKWKYIESRLKDLGKDDLIPKIKEWEFREDKPFFVWELEFSEVFRGENPGFDIVIGNPPYGAKLTKEEHINGERIPKKSESYFIKLSYDKLLKNKGVLGFIIPKPFTYTSSYRLVREHVMDNIETVIDCGKVWKNVKLEQIILFINKSEKFDYYNSGTRVDEILPIDLQINKNCYNDFEVILNGVNYDEINIAKKIKQSDSYLGEISEITSGSNLQEHQSDNGSFDFIGGKEIQREGIVGIKGQVEEQYVRDNDYIKNNSVLVQDVISHITKPKGHIKITACIPDTNELVICSTINQIITEDLNIYFTWALLNSNLINWYCHKFIYSNAIRTMHFNGPVIRRLPLPSMEDKKLINDAINKSKELYENYHELNELKKEMFHCIMQNSLKEFNLSKKIRNFEYLDYEEFIREMDSKNVDFSRINNFEEFFTNIKGVCLEFDERISSLEDELNNLIYGLYGLNDEESEIIDSNFKVKKIKNS